MVDTIRIGIGGPVGSGKTLLLQRIAEKIGDKVSMAIVTNDIYTKEDERYLKSTGVLSEDRIIGIETGGCPHTAIREDISMNAAAIDDFEEQFPDLQLVFVESGGDNLAATFSPELVDLSIYIIDVAQGEKIPRKGGQGMIKSDFFIINKTDLAPYVGANLEIMLKDTEKFRGTAKPTAFTNLKTGTGLDNVLKWIKNSAFLEV